jgi:hypothetical protein
MQTKVNYEWDLETIDCEYGDVTEHEFASARESLGEPGVGECIVLVCDILESDGSVVERGWAEVRPDGTLPEYFTDSACSADARRVRKVPQKFHDELARYEQKK